MSEVEDFRSALQFLKNRASIYISCDSTVQAEYFFSLERIFHYLKKLKKESVIKKQEDHANALLAMQYACICLQYKILFILALKHMDGQNAFDYLIAAQKYVEKVILCSEYINQELDAESVSDELLYLEKLCFPPQVFMSVGGYYEEDYCNICKDDSSKCIHLDRKPYMGMLCTITPRLTQWFEMSIVESPRNKHARVLSHIENGVETDHVAFLQTKSDANERHKQARIVNSQAYWVEPNIDELANILQKYLNM